MRIPPLLLLLAAAGVARVAEASTGRPCDVEGVTVARGSTKYVVGRPHQRGAIYATCDSRGTSACFEDPGLADAPAWAYPRVPCDARTIHTRRRKLGVAINLKEDKWPNGLVFYRFSEKYPLAEKERAMVRQAIAAYEATDLGVAFQECEPKALCKDKYVDISQKEDACYSYVGFTGEGGGQIMNLGKSCFEEPGTAVHEFGHALGLYHEHTHPERQVIVLTDGNLPVSASNYAKETDALLKPYDKGSIMHYGRSAGLCLPKDQYPLDSFCDVEVTTNCVMPKKTHCNNTRNHEIGQRTTLSAGDINTLKAIYGTQKPTLKPTTAPTPSPSSSVPAPTPTTAAPVPTTKTPETPTPTPTPTPTTLMPPTSSSPSTTPTPAPSSTTPQPSTTAPTPTTSPPTPTTTAPTPPNSSPAPTTTAPTPTKTSAAPTPASPTPTSAAPTPTTTAPRPTTIPPTPTETGAAPTTTTPTPTTAAPTPTVTTVAPVPTTKAPTTPTTAPSPVTTVPSPAVIVPTPTTTTAPASTTKAPTATPTSPSAAPSPAGTPPSPPVAPTPTTPAATTSVPAATTLNPPPVTPSTPTPVTPSTPTTPTTARPVTPTAPVPVPATVTPTPETPAPPSAYRPGNVIPDNNSPAWWFWWNTNKTNKKWADLPHPEGNGKWWQTWSESTQDVAGDSDGNVPKQQQHKQPQKQASPKPQAKPTPPKPKPTHKYGYSFRGWWGR